MKMMRGLGALALALLGLTPVARADILITFVNEANNNDGTFTYNYNLTVGARQTVNPGNFVTLYDVTGLLPTSIADPTGFTHTTQPLGITPSHPVPLPVPDDPSVLNITFTRQSSALTGPAGPLAFSFKSTQGVTSPAEFFAGQAVLTAIPFPAENLGFTTGPAAIPEPSVTAMAGMIGLLGVGYGKMRRGRKTA